MAKATENVMVETAEGVVVVLAGQEIPGSAKENTKHTADSK